MKLKWTGFFVGMTLILGSTPGLAAIVCGIATNAQGKPAAGVVVTAKDSAGNVLGQATTGADGTYKITGVKKGTIDLFLDPAGNPYKPGSGVLALTEASRDVNWSLSSAAAANAAQAGACGAGALTGAEAASLGVLGLGVAGAGAGIGFGLSQGGSEGRPSSPSR
jgi:hypothetical protein